MFWATWATGAFYQAFVPALVEDQLHTRSPLVLALVFASYMGPSALGAPFGGRWAPATAQRIGMIAFLVAWLVLVAAISTGGLSMFVVATLVGGAAQGIAISAATRGSDRKQTQDPGRHADARAQRLPTQIAYRSSVPRECGSPRCWPTPATG